MSSAKQEGFLPQHRPLRSLRHQAHGGSSRAEGPSRGHGPCAAVRGTEDQPATGSEHAHPPRLQADLYPRPSRLQSSLEMNQHVPEGPRDSVVTLGPPRGY